MKHNNRADWLERALLLSSAFFKRKKRMIAFIFLLVVVPLFIFLPSPYRILVIEEVKTGDVLWKQEISAEDWFEHQYIHSVEQSIVIEKFKLAENGQILAMESWTRSFGAGMPYEQKGTVEMKDGFYILSDLNDPIDSIHMQPSHLHLHTFHFKGEEIVLSEPPFMRNHIKIAVENIKWYEYTFTTLLNTTIIQWKG